MLTLSPVHRQTPTLTALDPRGLTVRSVDYWRDDGGQPAQARINPMAHDPQGRLIAQWDPRLWRVAQANLTTVYSLSAVALGTLSVDAGWRLVLAGEGEQPLEQWDGRGTRRETHYDEQWRPVAVFENGECTEQLVYGDATFSDCNQCGRLIRHDDPAGVLLFNGYGLSGAVREQERRFASESSSGFVSQSRLTPLGDVRSQIDAQGNEQRFSQTLGGQLRAVDLRLSNTTEWLPMVDAITYNAHGQVEQEVAGNGVITRLEYSAEDGRLERLVSRLGQEEPLQDLRYAYDPVGNVLSIEDAALPIRYFANQRIEPVNRYTYDSLSQLIEATGWEAGGVKHGPSAQPAESLANYRQTYRYDEGNNLLELTHVGAQNPGHRLVAAAHSNRCLPVRDGVEPGEEDFVKGFDANGNLLSLQPGQVLSWDLRNQLQEVRPVERETGPDDTERYSYGAGGMRVRKIRSLQTNAQTNLIENRYLPGLEIRTHSGTGEELHVIEVKTGRSHVRVLHWASQPPPPIANNQHRYSLTDHLGSSTLELDQDANLITQERYYPFGGTAWSNGEAVQVSYKTVRYSGKERDATGLYYYGFRYYMPERQRWLSPDPAGDVDGVNLYRMVRNNPMCWVDENGFAPHSPSSPRKEGPEVPKGETQNLAMPNAELKLPDADSRSPFRLEAEGAPSFSTFKVAKGAAARILSVFKPNKPAIATDQDFMAVRITVNGGSPVYGPVNLKKPFDAKRWTSNPEPMFVYRQDNRSLEEITSAGGFQPRGLELDTVEDHMLKSREYNYVSTSNVRLKGGSYGEYEYKIRLEPGQGIDTGEYLRTVFGKMTKKAARITEYSIPGGISPSQIVGVRQWKK